MSELTLGRLVEDASSSQRGVRFIDRWEKETFYSYREILHRASQTAGGLQEQGIGPGDRVAIILPTSIDF